MRLALNACREKRNISFECLDAICGAPSGYSAKILGPNPIRRIGLQSLDWVLAGLGVKAVLVDDPKALAKVKGRFDPRDDPHVRAARARWKNPEQLGKRRTRRRKIIR